MVRFEGGMGVHKAGNREQGRWLAEDRDVARANRGCVPSLRRLVRKGKQREKFVLKGANGMWAGRFLGVLRFASG
jgi:hypothetical protein